MGDAFPMIRNKDGSCPGGYKKDANGNCVPIGTGASTLDLQRKRMEDQAANLRGKDQEKAAAEAKMLKELMD